MPKVPRAIVFAGWFEMGAGDVALQMCCLMKETINRGRIDNQGHSDATDFFCSR